MLCGNPELISDMRTILEERGFEETDLPLAAYGDMLFDSPAIFGEPARSMGIACSTCHNRSDINTQRIIRRRVLCFSMISCRKRTEPICTSRGFCLNIK